MLIDSLTDISPLFLKHVYCVLQQPCEICHKNDFGEKMLLCDGCDCGTFSLFAGLCWCPLLTLGLGFHMYCLDPPLHSVPKGQWFCHTCLFGTGGDFGFDEGEDHSLSSFQARDAEFSKLWFTSHPPVGTYSVESDDEDPIVYKFGDTLVTEMDIEKEFWRLVQSPDETVEVEYGADVHSTTHGRFVYSYDTVLCYGS